MYINKIILAEVWPWDIFISLILPFCTYRKIPAQKQVSSFENDIETSDILARMFCLIVHKNRIASINQLHAYNVRASFAKLRALRVRRDPDET